MSDDLAYTGGWRRVGGILRPTAPRPTDEDDGQTQAFVIRGKQLNPPQAERDWIAATTVGILTRIADNLPTHVTTGALCECGCLLAHAAERCPACLVWAERQAVRQSWAIPLRDAA